MNQDIEKIIEGLEYKVRQVPFSQSRSKNNKTKTVEWICTINGREFEYSQGLGHLKTNYKTSYNRRTLDHLEAENEAIEKGYGYAYGCRARAVAPTLADVMYSLVLDSTALDYESFEDWAAEYGYDADSRAAEITYRACLDTALWLRHRIDLEAAREAFQDY